MATNRWWKLASWAMAVMLVSAPLVAQQPPPFAHASASPTRRAARFLGQRGLGSLQAAKPAGKTTQNAATMLMRARTQHAAMQRPADSGISPTTFPWTAVGPPVVQTDSFGLIAGRVTSIAADSNDASGNTIYVGTTGGGVWKSTNAAIAASLVTFSPLTDTLPAYGSAGAASLSIGAISVQPRGGTGVVLAGTGDPNDATDSYYGTGILRSADGGNTWALIPGSQDGFHGGFQNYSFTGEGFAAFAWSTANTQLVVAAVAQSAEGVAVNAPQQGNSFAGLYYSTDAGQTWFLATITDGPQHIIQSPTIAPTEGDPGNSATSVTWNPLRQRFYAAVRYHGYYESLDGITWTRLANQPGVNLFPAQCPANPDSTGSPACPIFRGTITTQPVTGDMFAITVDNNNQDQGLWQDLCTANGSSCASQTVTFASQIADTAIDVGGSTSIPQGDYDLSLAAVPSQQDTLLFVGTQDIFRCSLANSCAWRNTTNVNGCQSAAVAPSQHAFDATFGAGGLMYFGNDGGLWRSTDGVNQQQPRCSAEDAAHFQNLNSGLGSLAEVASFSEDSQTPGSFMAAMGAFGTAAQLTEAPAWQQVLDGEGSFNAIDPVNPLNWYATSAFPIAINRCTQGASCNGAGFGLPVIGNAQVGDDGYGLTESAPWILDPQNSANIIVGTCRVWRGPASGGVDWNAVSPMLDGIEGPSYCDGNAQVRSLAASGSQADAPGTPERMYAGMTGVFDGGATVPGHIYGASVNGAPSNPPAWTDLANSPVVNNQTAPVFNPGGFDISSIYTDPHDTTGNTVYVTLQGFIQNGINGSLVYRSTDGGAHWSTIASNLPNAPMNSIIVDPNDAKTVYIASDIGVYVTRNVALCEDNTQYCWGVFGTGLPNAPVTQLLAFNYGGASYLRAATYGRGIWQTPLATAGVLPGSAKLVPASLSFASQPQGTTSAAQTVTFSNTGTVPLSVSDITMAGDFSQQNDCSGPVAPSLTCSIQVSFTPTQTGQRTGSLTVFTNVQGGQLTAALNGTGTVPGDIVLMPITLNFGNVLEGVTTPAQNITISNTGGSAVHLQSPAISGDFQVAANTCGTSLAPNTGCTVAVTFTPAASGTRTGVFSITDDAGTQTAQLSGNGQALPTAVVSPMALSFAPLMVGARSTPQQINLANNGDAALNNISIASNGDFAITNGCGTVLSGHTACAFSVVYVPTQIGTESGQLLITTQLGTQTVNLSGTGLAPPGISATPMSFNFGQQGVGTTSAQQPFTLTNNGGSSLSGLTFAASGDFAVASNDCPSSGLSVGQACHVNVAFTPAQAGARNGTLTLNAKELSSPLAVALTGAGEDFQLVVNGPTNDVLVAGQTATYSVQLVPVNGSSGTFAMSCTGAPANATCMVNPPSLSVNGSTGSATVTVATSSSTSSASASSWERGGIALAFLLPGAGLLFRRKKVLMKLWIAGIAVIFLLLPSACGTQITGGNSKTSTGPPQGGSPTPSGSYTLTIAAATPGLQRTVQVTLTIQ